MLYLCAKISLDCFHVFQDLNKYFMKAFAEVRDKVLVAIKHEKAAFERKVEQLARNRKRYRANGKPSVNPVLST